jgi:hypothetical protein
MNSKTKIELVKKFIFNDEVKNIFSKINGNVMDFNILEITGMGNQEIKHSNILAWLFDDSEHNLEYYLLDNFLRKVIQLNSCSDLQSYLYLSNKKRDINIYREKDNIDLLIIDESNKIIITIENKVYANERIDGEDGGQLQKYEDIINYKYMSKEEDKKNGYDKYFIYLTINLEKPSKDNWLRANHQMITDSIEDILKTKEIVTKTKIILESYIDLLKRNGIVEDEKLKKLCKQIWAKEDYRNALNILYENKPTNINIISKIITERLRKINITDIKFYANKKNDILFRTKNMDENIQFNLYFGYWGIELALYINTEEDKYNIYHKKIFPQKSKKNHRNKIKINTKDDCWNNYLDDVLNENIHIDIKDDLDLIFQEITQIDKKILEIKL